MQFKSILYQLLILCMKKIFGIILILFFSVSSFAQLSINGNYITVSASAGVDNIYIFSKIDNTSEIHYTASNASSNVKWYTYSSLNSVEEMTDVSVLSATETYIDPKNNTGYILEVDGNRKAVFWVFDYSEYLPDITSISAGDSDYPCETVNLVVNGNVPELSYQNTSGTVLKLNRTFTLTYNTLEWSETDNQWNEKEVDYSLTLPASNPVELSVPYVNTTYTLTGDEYAAQLGLQQISIVSSEYITKAVDCKLTSQTSTVRKDVLNENERPESADQLSGSAPMDINFYSNPTHNVTTFSWKIYKDGSTSPLISRTGEDNSYTFDEAGTYIVKTTVSNQYCAVSDSVTVTISESMLVAPKVFTPNGDGIQDEFKVAYESIVEFSGIIFNRWGRKIFTWTNPAKGWDGKIGGKDAAEGTYYYVIKGKGADNVKYKLKGYFSLLR